MTLNIKFITSNSVTIQVIFIICAVVALTILINGTFSRSFYTEMYRKINSQTAEADSVILHYVRKRIWQKAEIGKYLLDLNCVLFPVILCLFVVCIIVAKFWYFNFDVYWINFCFTVFKFPSFLFLFSIFSSSFSIFIFLQYYLCSSRPARWHSTST